VVGYGRVGSLLGRSLAASGRSVLVFEEREVPIAAARQDGAEVVIGNAADPEVLAAANPAAARRLFITVAEAFEAGQIVQQARAANPGLEIAVRAHFDAEVDHLNRLGADLTVMGEREIAHRMIEWAQRGEGPAASTGTEAARTTAHGPPPILPVDARDGDGAREQRSSSPREGR